MSFLWVDCNEQRPEKRADVLQAARQHVMVNYYARNARKSDVTAGAIIAEPSMQQATPSDRVYDCQVSGNLKNHSANVPKAGREPKARSNRRTKQSGSRACSKSGVSLMQVRPIDLPTPPLTPVLISQHDQQLYQAAWWHSYHTRPNDSGYWIAECRTAWSQGFWDFAKEDTTLREIFMCFAAAKEAAVRDAAESKSYFAHKGRAMQLIRNDLQSEGKDLRMAGIAVMCLLCKTSFIEQDFEAAESHLRAICSLVSDRLQDLLGFLWLFVVWADLRLTGVSIRAPCLPYCLHPDFEHASLPPVLAEQAKFLASCNALSLPSMPITSRELSAASLFELLHSLALSYDKADVIGTGWLAPWSLSYQIAYKVSKLRNQLEMTTGNIGEEDFSAERLVVTAASMAFWAMSMQFVPQPGSLRHHQEQMAKQIKGLDPTVLVERWSAAGGSLDSLLWILFMAGAYALKERVIGLRVADEMPFWLWKDLSYLLAAMKITAFASFESSLRTFPYANHWSKRMAGPMYVWITTGFALSAPSVRPPGMLFAELRLTFDSDADERMDAKKRPVLHTVKIPA